MRPFPNILSAREALAPPYSIDASIAVDRLVRRHSSGWKDLFTRSLCRDLSQFDLLLGDRFPSLVIEDASRIRFGEIAEVSIGTGSAAAEYVSVLADLAVSSEVLAPTDGFQHGVVVPDG